MVSFWPRRTLKALSREEGGLHDSTPHREFSLRLIPRSIHLESVSPACLARIHANLNAIGILCSALTIPTIPKNSTIPSSLATRQATACGYYMQPLSSRVNASPACSSAYIPSGLNLLRVLFRLVEQMEAACARPLLLPSSTL